MGSLDRFLGSESTWRGVKFLLRWWRKVGWVDLVNV
jgi:hypothetical protein